MTDPLVSIIVPVYNVENYISECVESIQKQTYQNLQILLIDDGSTDQSGIMCDAYAEKDRRIRVIHQPNRGLVAARKRGLADAGGKYIGFVDGDDCITPDMYQALTDRMETSGADFVHSGYLEKGGKKAAGVKGVINLAGRDRKYKFLKDAVLGTGSYISPSIWSKLFKADLIKKSYMQVPDANQYGEDLINLCICVMESSKAVLMNAAYYHYRVRKGSLSNRETIDSFKDTVKMYESICGILESYGYAQELKSVMDKFLWGNLLGRIDMVGRYFQVEKYFFRNVDILEGKKIVVYGAGKVGRDYYAQICRYTGCRVVAWADACPERYNYPHIRLYGTGALNSMEFDLLVIAVKDGGVAREICTQLAARGIERNKIYWSKPEVFLPDDIERI